MKSKFLCLVLIACPALAGGFAAPDEAFKLTAQATGNIAVIQIDILPNYYLYRDQLKVIVDKVPMKKVVISGQRAQLDFNELGRFQVYMDTVSLKFEMPQHKVAFIEYQGCSRQGVCYPPQRKKIQF